MKENCDDLELLWSELCSDASIRSSPDYWNGRAEDYADYILNSNFDHGRKILELFKHEGIIKNEMTIMDIGSGPVAISIPFAEEVSAVTSIEPAKEMSKKLKKFAEMRKLSNITIIPEIWQNVQIDDMQNRYDLVISCHSIWHFPDLYHQIIRMQQVSKGYCAIAHSIPFPGDGSDITKKLQTPGDDTDRFIIVKNILEKRGIYPHVSIIQTHMKRTVDSARSMLVLGLKKFREPDQSDLALIEEHLASISKDGMYEREGKMGILWWRA